MENSRVARKLIESHVASFEYIYKIVSNPSGKMFAQWCSFGALHHHHHHHETRGSNQFIKRVVYVIHLCAIYYYLSQQMVFDWCPAAHHTAIYNPKNWCEKFRKNINDVIPGSFGSREKRVLMWTKTNKRSGWFAKNDVGLYFGSYGCCFMKIHHTLNSKHTDATRISC